MNAVTCRCGCGEEVNPGYKFRRGHATRLRPKNPTSLRYNPTFVRCEACGNNVAQKSDGTLGRHFIGASRKYLNDRCPAGEGLRPDEPVERGHRVTVSIDAVIPQSWTVQHFRARAAAVLRRELADAFVITTDTASAGESS